MENIGCRPDRVTAGIRDALLTINQPYAITRTTAESGIMATAVSAPGGDWYLPAMPIRQMGSPFFCADHGLTYPYMCGAMANGIASVELVAAIAKAGMLGSFGAAGLSVPAVGKAIDRLQRDLGSIPFAVNFIHSPSETGTEGALADLLLQKKVHLVEASAFLRLTPAVVRYRLHGIHRDAEGRVIAPNRVIAKISRMEVAAQFMAPAPADIVATLLQAGAISREQAELAAFIPVAQDITVEADSGGHTDNRPAITLLPLILALRDRIQAEYHYDCQLRVGLGGGIATPASAAAAFSMGAAYIVTGTINQCTREAGTSAAARKMLAQAQQADVIMAPAADMFAMGVKVQVLKRGTMFAMRATKLFELYKAYPSVEAIPASERESLEKTIFRQPLATVWQETAAYFQQRDPSQLQRAAVDPKHKMELIFRSYLGRASHWANDGEPTRQIDYQIWCGPAMGAFNEWVKGTFLEPAEQRDVVTIALNILFLAAVRLRANSLAYQGLTIAPEDVPASPMPSAEIKKFLPPEICI